MASKTIMCMPGNGFVDDVTITRHDLLVKGIVDNQNGSLANVVIAGLIVLCNYMVGSKRTDVQ